MSQMVLHFKNRVQSISIMNNNIALSKLTLSTIFFTLIFLTFLYVFILGSMVFNIVERRTLEKQALVLSNEVSDLELSYLSLADKVDMNLSLNMGFKEIQATFATRQSSVGRIKLARNEI